MEIEELARELYKKAVSSEWDDCWDDLSSTKKDIYLQDAKLYLPALEEHARIFERRGMS